MQFAEGGGGNASVQKQEAADEETAQPELSVRRSKSSDLALDTKLVVLRKKNNFASISVRYMD